MVTYSGCKHRTNGTTTQIQLDKLDVFQFISLNQSLQLILQSVPTVPSQHISSFSGDDTKSAKPQRAPTHQRILDGSGINSKSYLSVWEPLSFVEENGNNDEDGDVAVSNG